MRKPKVELTDEIKALEKQSDPEWITLVRRYEVITPIYGGGVEAEEIDPVTPIRSTEVRGQLRFWWRAARGGHYGPDLHQMKEVEDTIWGGASKQKRDKEKSDQPRTVQVQILEADPGKKLEVFEVIRNPKDPGKTKVEELNKADIPAYAAFPLRPENDAPVGTKSPPVFKGSSFTLRISFGVKFKDDVEAALWAWETFGGYGARTRRGFGALRLLLKDVGAVRADCDSRVQEAQLENQLKEHDVTGEWPANIPHLAVGMKLRAIAVPGDAIDAWKWLIGAFRDFRQSREDNAYGPSHWPETNAARQAARKPASSKSPNLGNKTPRAVFGLPIIFHFPQEKDMPDVTLKGKNSERLASPLILKPLYCDQYNTIALAAVLEGPHVPLEGLVLEVAGGSSISADPDLDAKKEAPLIKPLKGEADVLKAFLDSL